MAEWLYKATPARVPLDTTRDLAVNDGFICRSAYEHGGKQARADHTTAVALGDIVHVYFVEDGRSTVIGSFAVVHATHHPQPHRFGPTVEGTCLHEIVDSDFTDMLQGLPRGQSGTGYEPDPKVGQLTGWAVRQVLMRTPPYDASKFPAQRTLVKA